MREVGGHGLGLQGNQRPVVGRHSFEIQLVLVRIVCDQIALRRREEHRFERRFGGLVSLIFPVISIAPPRVAFLTLIVRTM
jgi:hypothetical protein